MKAMLYAAAIGLLLAGSAVALTGGRMAEIPLDKMTPAQRTVADAIMSGPRKGMSGPFNAWLRSPELADRLQKVGEYVRFNTSLDKRLNEMAIIMTAQFWGSQYEWYAHAPLAIKAGLSPEIVADLKARKRPANMKEDEAAVYDFVTELSAKHEVSDQTFARAKQVLGEQQVVDLTAVSGTYVTVAMILAMAEEGVPPGKESPFKPGDP